MTFILGLIIGAAIVLAVELYRRKKDAAQYAAETSTADAGGKWWTVIGVWANPIDMNRSERFSFFVQADDPHGAEDLAQWEANRREGTLWVAAVVEGKVLTHDTYATFVDPEIKPVDWMHTENSHL